MHRIILLLMTIFIISASLGNGIKMEQYLPKYFDNWENHGADEYYDKSTLYDLIDGGAELYLSYNFNQLLLRRFVNPHQQIIEVNFFDMETSENAFGIFHHDLEDDAVGIGTESEYGFGWLRFWKGKYFVYIFAEDETPEIKKSILTLGNIIANNIFEPGNIPEVVQYLPSSGLIAKSLRYFQNYQTLNYHFYLSNDNILNLSENVHALLAKYQNVDDSAWLLLVTYDTAEHSTKAFVKFKHHYLPELERENPAITENEKWTGAQITGNYLALVLDASSSTYANNLIKATLENIEGIRHEK